MSHSHCIANDSDHRVSCSKIEKKTFQLIVFDSIFLRKFLQKGERERERVRLP